MTGVTLRKVPGALALGLLASLAAHAALYGGDHAMGGAYHALLLEAALAGAVGLLVFFGGMAWAESGLTANGSVLAVRLRERLPTLWATTASAAGCYGLSEGLEPHHTSASSVATAIALIAGAWLVRSVVRAVVDVFASAAVATLQVSFAPRTPSWNRRERVRPIPRRTPLIWRRFARPPPIVSVLCA
jgi:hypothetical protein